MNLNVNQNDNILQFSTHTFSEQESGSVENDVVTIIHVNEEKAGNSLSKDQSKPSNSMKITINTDNDRQNIKTKQNNSFVIGSAHHEKRVLSNPHYQKNGSDVQDIHQDPIRKEKRKTNNIGSNIVRNTVRNFESMDIDNCNEVTKHIERNQTESMPKNAKIKHPDKRPLPRPRSKTIREFISKNGMNNTSISEQQVSDKNASVDEVNEVACKKDTKITFHSEKVSMQCEPNLQNEKESIQHTEYDVNNSEQSGIVNRTDEIIHEAEINDESQLQKIIAIIIHQSDYLQADVLIQHPLVKVYILDTYTGKYLKKSSPDRPVSFYHENKDVNYILPLMTKSFDFKLKRILVPMWEELLLFNEDIQYILKDEPPVLIMFELLDFVTFSIANSRYKRLGSEGGWHKIAWAFLKPLGANKHYNTEKKLRLQLYKPGISSKTTTECCEIFSWWSEQKWERYPATLYVTVKGVMPPKRILPAMRSQVVLQQEKTSDRLEFNKFEEADCRSETSAGIENSKNHRGQIQSCPVWSRFPAQSCKIPNECKLSIPTSSNGCFLVKFSNSGLLMACTMANEDMFSINIYSIPDGKEYGTFLGHRGLIYDLDWSSSDSILLSGSADCTVCIWDIERKRTNCLQMLPHPSFVYAAKFNEHRSWLLATGCNDRIVRLWIRQQKTNHYDLVQELEGHQGFINSLCFIQQNSLVSADGIGCIFLWSCDENSFSRKNVIQWEKIREFYVREIKGIIINKVILHPGRQRLLIHTRDNLLRMLDLTTGIVIQWFRGTMNHRVQTTSCITPCGGLVFAASEDGAVYVWNADTGELVALYSGLNFYNTVSCIDFHPFDHMVAFSSYGVSSRVLICVHSKHSNGTQIGLHFFNQNHILSNIIANELQQINSHIPVQNKQSNFTQEHKDMKVHMKEVNPDNKNSPSAFWNATFDSNLLESAYNSDNYKKKIDLVHLIKQMDKILSSNNEKNIDI